MCNKLIGSRIKASSSHASLEFCMFSLGFFFVKINLNKFPTTENLMTKVTQKYNKNFANKFKCIIRQTNKQNVNIIKSLFIRLV